MRFGWEASQPNLIPFRKGNLCSEAPGRSQDFGAVMKTICLRFGWSGAVNSSSHSLKRALLLLAEEAGMAQVLRSMLAHHCKNLEGAIRAYSLNTLIEPLQALKIF